ncbi:MAG: DNA adenine methylase [Proteobacteria bacterium]|nr:DNA adenine methylase [Pseudomonadota bacterium]MBU2226754.1 DNA adenine methylase [Pseudomonadota bacterium]MBU2261324.1 DNA adenine methylase [Pseudomonadota bacterium]
MRNHIVRKLDQQAELIAPDPVFPSTRFQGSKLKIADWIWESIQNLNFDSALDAFGGTGSIGYLFKKKGKKVTYNDILKFNWYIGQASIENDTVKLTPEDIDFIIKRHAYIKYPSFVQDTFRDIYFTEEENRWIDTAVTNIRLMNDIYKKSLAYFSLFQSCISKRPFNLFHRKNLYLRLSEVKRNFGNKATWDTPFETHFRKFSDEANRAVFSNGQGNRCLNLDIFDVKGNYDLVYIDTPYMSHKGFGVDYFGFYHFLEGLAHYETWHEMIDYRTKHKRLKGGGGAWTDKKLIQSAFDQLFRQFHDSILVVSYRSDGIPSLYELVNLLKKYKQNVQDIKRKNYKYVLSTNHSEEVLLIGV